MRDFSVLSRRDVLRMAGAVGGLVVTGVGQIRAQSAKKIESMAPELDRIIGTGEPIRELATGYGGDIGPAEGPVWWAEGRYLLFNDIHTARRMKYTPGQGATVAMEKTNEANGLTRDLQGRLISAEHLTRRVTRYEPDGSVTVIANSFQGKRLLRPNDVIVKSDGPIYFTYSGGSGGLFVIDPKGNKLGRIVHGQPATTNVAFGGDDWKTLYFTTRSTLFSVAVKFAGVPVPVKKRS